jgi:hypothetical protein
LKRRKPIPQTLLEYRVDNIEQRFATPEVPGQRQTAAVLGQFVMAGSEQ